MKAAAELQLKFVELVRLQYSLIRDSQPGLGAPLDSYWSSSGQVINANGKQSVCLFRWYFVLDCSTEFRVRLQVGSMIPRQVSEQSSVQKRPMILST